MRWADRPPFAFAAGLAEASEQPAPPDEELQSRWAALAPDLARACLLAAQIQQTVSQTLGLWVSIGVGRTRLLARLLSPLHRPAAITALPDALAAAFLAARPLLSIPQLRGKAGEAAAEALGVATVGELQRFAPAELAARVPPRLARMLARLAATTRCASLRAARLLLG
jgi:nucleotidyltransferase/DNA polymerase involved in DNA repair